MKFPDAQSVMQHALALARQGLGHVEPNPQVGAVLVDEDFNLLGAGYHENFGAAHAEVNAIRQAQGRAGDATLYVTLEPCCHTGQTGPCTSAILQAGIRRVVVATADPAAHTAGQGVEELKAAGVAVTVGLLEEEARALIAPFAKLQLKQRPFVHAKWAMSLDGKIATRTGSSQWISNEQSRAVVHELRGRMDAVLVGIGTALADDPLLTARPAGPRTACRVVLDSAARLPLNSQLAQTADSTPVLLVVSNNAAEEKVTQLQARGVEVVQEPSTSSNQAGQAISADWILEELGRRNFTNLLVEGGAQLLGSFVDEQLVDEFHIFIAPKLIGGVTALSPVGGVGLEQVPQADQLILQSVKLLGNDIYLNGRWNNFYQTDT